MTPNPAARPGSLRAAPRRGAARRCCCAVLASLAAAPLAAATLTEHMDLGCVQERPLELECRYRLLEPGELRSAAAEALDLRVPGEDVSRFPAANDSVGALLLVDTSDPARQPVIEANVRHVEQLLAQVPAHYRLGIAGFDTNLYVLAPVGSPPSEIRAGAATLRATGRTTELYRNVLEAVRLLGRTEDARRTLFVFSDGLAEDRAYHHDDVITLARQAGVVIHGIGYPRSVAQSVALQTLRRLAAETGGLYVQADHVDNSLPTTAFERMLATTDSGGVLRFDLAPLVDTGAAGPLDLTLSFETDAQRFGVRVPIELPPAAPAAEVPSAPASPAVTGAAARPAAAAPANGSRAVRPWLVALVVMLAATLIGVAALLRRNRSGAGAGEPGARPFAWLVPLDEAGVRHGIHKTPWRIGRGRNNDLTLSDHSVSRLHAEIRSNEEGALLLKDLESLNGVFVNDDRVDAIELREGDAVDIGDVRLHFTLHDEDYAAEEPTVLVRTRTPI